MPNTHDSGLGAITPGSAEQVQQAMAAGMTRRAALKRAGLVVGATAWATPVVQTVFAGTAAATHIGGLPHPPVGTCNQSDPSGCGSAPCTQCGAGKTCSGASDCLSGECSSNGMCAKSNYNEACATNNDCHSGICGAAGVCSKAVAGGTCAVGSDCTTNICSSGGVCQTAPTNGSCSTTADCTKPAQNRTVTCFGGVCGGIGAPCGHNTECHSGNCPGGPVRVCAA